MYGPEPSKCDTLHLLLLVRVTSTNKRDVKVITSEWRRVEEERGLRNGGRYNVGMAERMTGQDRAQAQCGPEEGRASGVTPEKLLPICREGVKAQTVVQV